MTKTEKINTLIRIFNMSLSNIDYFLYAVYIFGTETIEASYEIQRISLELTIR